jgi:hypothetical protein
MINKVTGIRLLINNNNLTVTFNTTNVDADSLVQIYNDDLWIQVMVVNCFDSTKKYDGIV